MESASAMMTTTPTDAAAGEAKDVAPPPFASAPSPSPRSQQQQEQQEHAGRSHSAGLRRRPPSAERDFDLSSDDELAAGAGAVLDTATGELRPNFSPAGALGGPRRHRRRALEQPPRQQQRQQQQTDRELSLAAAWFRLLLTPRLLAAVLLVPMAGEPFCGVWSFCQRLCVFSRVLPP